MPELLQKNFTPGIYAKELKDLFFKMFSKDEQELARRTFEGTHFLLDWIFFAGHINSISKRKESVKYLSPSDGSLCMVMF